MTLFLSVAGFVKLELHCIWFCENPERCAYDF